MTHHKPLIVGIPERAHSIRWLAIRFCKKMALLSFITVGVFPMFMVRANELPTTTRRLEAAPITKTTAYKISQEDDNCEFAEAMGKGGGTIHVPQEFLLGTASPERITWWAQKVAECPFAQIYDRADIVTKFAPLNGKQDGLAFVITGEASNSTWVLFVKGANGYRLVTKPNVSGPIMDIKDLAVFFSSTEPIRILEDPAHHLWYVVWTYHGSATTGGQGLMVFRDNQYISDCNPPKRLQNQNWEQLKKTEWAALLKNADDLSISDLPSVCRRQAKDAR